MLQKLASFPGIAGPQLFRPLMYTGFGLLIAGAVIFQVLRTRERSQRKRDDMNGSDEE